MQIASDLVAQGPLAEVAAAVAANSDFTLKGEPTSSLMNALDTASLARAADDDHVQWQAEWLLSERSGAGELQYARGRAGFAGFPSGGNGRSGVRALSPFTQSRLGERWNHWGSEQVASNFIVVNTKNPLLLFWERYPG